MVIPCAEQIVTDGYKYRMMEMNRIEGLLECTVRCFDGKKYLYYDITGRQSMQNLYENKPLVRKDVVCFLTALDKVKNTLADFLLDGDNLVLAAELVYYDFKNDTCLFAYNPDADPLEESVFEFIARNVDKADHDLSASALRLCAAEEKSEILQEAVQEELRKLSQSVEEDFIYGQSSKKGSERYFSEEKYETSPEQQPVKEEKRRGGTPSNDKEKKKGLALRILLIIFIALATIGIFALPEILYMTFVVAKLCRVGSVLMLIADALMVLDAISYSKKGGAVNRLEKDIFLEKKKQKAQVTTETIPEGTVEKYSMRLDHETVPLSLENLPGKLYGSGENRGLRISFEQLPFTIGKAEQYVDCVINDSSISRIHARFYRSEQGDLYVKDLGSTNGTFVNGAKLGPNESKRLQRGDELILGNVELVYR